MKKRKADREKKAAKKDDWRARGRGRGPERSARPRGGEKRGWATRYTNGMSIERRMVKRKLRTGDAAEVRKLQRKSQSCCRRERKKGVGYRSSVEGLVVKEGDGTRKRMREWTRNV